MIPLTFLRNVLINTHKRGTIISVFKFGIFDKKKWKILYCLFLLKPIVCIPTN